MTVPERALKTSSLRIKTGRRPDCSCPRVGSSSAQTISPFSREAILVGRPLGDFCRQTFLRESLLFHRVEFGTLLGEPRLADPCDFLLDSGLNGLTAAGENL